MRPRPELSRSNLPAMRRLLLLCAFLLILAQAFLTVHSVDHLSCPDDGSCQVCLQGVGLDNAAVDTSGPVLVSGPIPDEAPVQTSSKDTEHTSFFQQRAPPHSPIA